MTAEWAMFNQHYVNQEQIDALSLKTNKENHNLSLLMITKGLSNLFHTQQLLP